MVRPTYVEIDLEAVAANVLAFTELISPAEVCTVVKADAYGHGDVPVANAALDSGAAMLAVALVEEGVRLREAGIDAPVLLLSEPPPGSAHELAKWRLQPTAYSQRFVDELETTGSRHRVHILVDTGMHRVGAPPEELPALVAAVSDSKTLDLASIWTHFPVADEDAVYTRAQIEVFDRLVAPFQPVRTHLANTAGAVLFPEARHDLCRIGLGTYGLHPCGETVGRIELAPAMRLITHVSHVQHLAAGERPSYGRVKPLARASNVVTAPVGYADGFTRALTDHSSALIGGQRFPLAGTVTMDQIVIDVGDEDIDVGEEIVLLGSQGDQTITADEWADQLGTISYEVVCSIGPRVPRRYV
ncbi:MAG: alanine racemase [Acidimicrobiia bacterium]|jgi:alanine racemase